MGSFKQAALVTQLKKRKRFYVNERKRMINEKEDEPLFLD
jgi:hypothetical protein